MAKKKIGLLFGMEDTFPWALIEEINGRGEDVEAELVQINAIKDIDTFPWALVLDRISHEVPFYRTFLKVAKAKGVIVFSSPFWSAADDKFLNNVIAEAFDVAVPRTVLLPHKQHPPGTEPKSFRNLTFVEWDEIFAYLGFPIFMKPAYGGGWKDVYKVDDADQFFSAYDQTRDLCMMAQEAIDFTEYFRCYVLGRERVRVMQYDPKQSFFDRYVKNPPPLDPALLERVERDALTLTRALSYDMNTCEFAVRDGIPYAIDFMNSAPDADRHSVGEENFQWVVKNMADVLIDRVHNPRPFELTGDWPEKMGLLRKPAAGRKKAAPKAPSVD